MTTLMLMFREYRVSPAQNSETTDRFFGKVARYKISGERRLIDVVFKDTQKMKFCSRKTNKN